MRKTKLTIAPHYGKDPDWCYLCGKRRTDCVDIRGLEVSRLLAMPNPFEAIPLQYLRICGACAGTIAETAETMKTEATP